MPRKKKKKPRRQRARVSFPAKFVVGAQVRVKPGTTDLDFSDIPLGGWAGAIIEVNPQLNLCGFPSVSEWLSFSAEPQFYRAPKSAENLALKLNHSRF